MGPGQLLQAAFILSVGKGCVENIDDIELGNREDMAPVRKVDSLAVVYSL